MPSDTTITEKALNKKVPNAYDLSDNSLELIKFLTSFFDESSRTIYNLVQTLGSCPAVYTRNAFDKDIYQKICKLALNDFLKIKADNGLYSVSINFKIKNSEQKTGYTLPCAFASSKDIPHLPSDYDDITKYYGNDSAKTHKINDKYIILNLNKEKNYPHHGISFSERFIENIDFDNMEKIENPATIKNKDSAKDIYKYGDSQNYTYYKVKKKNVSLTQNAFETNDAGYILYNKDKLATLFDDGSNRDRIYPKKDKLVQHRNQAAFFPIECKKTNDQSNRFTKRIGYIQLTAYYTNKETSFLTGENKELNKEIVDKFKFYANWALLANKIFNIEKTKIEKRSENTHLLSIGKNYDVKVEPLSNRCLINYEEN